MPSFFGLGGVVGSYSERLALASPGLGLLFYQSDTDEYLKYATDRDGTARWMQANIRSGRNIVINGSFNVWQRGTAFSSGAVGTTAVTSGYYTVDRWQVLRNSAVAGATFSQISAPSASGLRYGLRLQRDSGNTATNDMGMYTSFETTNVVNMQGKYATLSFWARCGANFSPTSTRITVRVVTGTGTDSNLISGFTSAAYPVDTTQTLTTSWVRYSFTTSAALASTVTQLGVAILANPIGTAGANDWFEVTGVQLESGTAPSEFEFIAFDVELARCQRYYETSYTYGVSPINNAGGGVTASLENSGHHAYIVAAGSTPVTITYRVLKRIIPTTTNYSYNGIAGRYSYRDNAADNVGVVTYARNLAGGFGVVINSGNNWSVGGTLWLGWVANAEL